MFLKRLFPVLFALIIPTLLFADGGLYENKVISQINIEFQNLPEGSAFNKTAVLNKMQTRQGAPFSQDEFDQDLKALACDYDRIEPSLSLTQNHTLHLVLNIWVKPTIRSVIFCGNERVSSKKLLKKSGLKIGQTLERDEFIESINKLRTLYIRKGYFEAELSFEVESIDACGEAAVTIYINEGRAGKINKILFSGLDRCEEADILDMMVTKKFNLFYSWFSGAGVYHPEMIEHDRLQIINYLQNLGYADAYVDLCLEESGGNRITICISVDKGCIYRFGNMRLTGNGLFSKEQIYDQFQVFVNGPYSPDALRATSASIEDLYGSYGYIDTYVEVQLIPHETEAVYDVCFNVVEGEQYRVGLIKVFGNNTTDCSVILHESLLCPGEIFNTNKLAGTERRIGNTGLFSGVNVYAVSSQELEEDGPSFRDVYIEVEEADTGHLGLFFGFSSLDRLFGGAEISERNFNAKGIFNMFQYGPSALRGGGEYVNMKANFGDRQRTYLFQWTKPYFMDTPWIVGFDLEKSDNRAISRGYDIKTWGGHVTATYICNDYLKYAAHYRATQTHNSLRSNSTPLLEQEGRISGFISGVGLTMIYDSTDHPRRPTHGFRSRLYGEVMGLGGNFEFFKMGYLNSYYYPILRKGVLKFRFDLQFIHTYGRTSPTDLPLAERFYLGGETTVRGYRPYIIGPKFAANEPRGGVSSLLVSDEFQHPLFPGVDWFIFADGGYVSLSEFTLGELSSSVGFGLRVDLVKNMPFCVGLGYPIHPGSKETQRFFFSMGGTF